MPRLRENIIGVNRNVYGMAGDTVRVVSDHDNVQIVEDESGNRFAVRNDKLTYDDAPIKAVPIEKSITVKPSKTGNKKQLSTQQNLF
ncbi:MAG: hypothetical protein ACTHLE_04345 [Agriterribacter sp.]